ncbi:MAG: M24 family metallopeptidase [Chloroflexi bacterium]|nr:M24 family metallopeptidase [Chloroflexota bacterium]
MVRPHSTAHLRLHHPYFSPFRWATRPGYGRRTWCTATALARLSDASSLCRDFWPMEGHAMDAGSLMAFPRFSLAERERRWSAVREAMVEEHIDCLITPSNTGHSTHFQAESRYLTHCGGGGDADIACVFPLDGEVAAIATTCDRWRHVQEWVTDLREARRAYGRRAAEKLRDVKLVHRRVGIVGLSGYIRAPEGTVLHGFMQALTDAFPDVDWVDFSDQLQHIRMIKSPEEIAFLEKSTELVDRAFRRIVDVAGPGVKDYDAWGAAIGELCKGGSELPVHNHWGSGPRPTTLTRPTHGDLQRGHLIVNEIEAAYGGYHAQGVQPIAIEECDPVYRALYAMHAEYWQRCFDALAVGRTVGELDDVCRETAIDVVPSGGRFEDVRGRLAMHGRGLGSDAPLVTGTGRSPRTMAEVFQSGWAFVFKPSLSVRTESRAYSAIWGDTVVMTDRGARRLGTRQPGLAVAGAR